MSGTSLLACLTAAGFEVIDGGENVIVAPRDRLTDGWRNRIKSQKSELLAAIRSGNANSAQIDGESLANRIRLMAQRWNYTPEELAEALASATVDPQGWLSWTQRDEEHFGDCRTPEEFAARYAQVRRLA